MNLIPLARPVFDSEMRDAAIAAFDEHYLLGESVARFEDEFAKYHGVKYGVAVASGTAALQFSYMSLNSRFVATTPLTFIATANAAIHARAQPIFRDIDSRTLNLFPHGLKTLKCSEGLTVAPVYLYGRPADMETIQGICREMRFGLVADACQAHGATYKNKPIGSLADATCFSFYPSKNVTVCGDGGMVITDDEEIAAKVRKLRDCGRVSKYEHDVIGYTSRMSSVAASIGLVQLKRLPEWVRRRRFLAAEYHKVLSDFTDIQLPLTDSETYQSAWHLYVIRTQNRDALSQFLKEKGIETGVHYPIPVHLQPIYRKLYGYSEGAYHYAEEAAKTVLSLPIYPSLTDDELLYICDSIAEWGLHG